MNKKQSSISINIKKQNVLLIISIVIAIILLLIRVKITHSIYLMFLIWNIFLALIPLFLSEKIIKIKQNKKIITLFLLAIWLLFLPNTFYLITDFEHLHFKNNSQFILDWLIFSSFSVAGCHSGLLSIKQIHLYFLTYFSAKTSNAIILIICMLTAFGIYLGRVLRFNSWDILTNTKQLIQAIFLAVFQTNTLFYTLKLSLFILITYTIFYKLKQKS